jgi:hypothetical protein
MCLALALVLAPGGLQAAAPGPLRGASGLARAYDRILDARFDEVGEALSRACGPAPAEACLVLDATALWWRIRLDPDSTARDATLVSVVEAAIAATEAWTAREPDRAEAWFYLGGAYAVRVQWRVLRGARLAAARDGRRIKQALDRALALDPTLEDAHFGLGMYEYYAAVAPAAARLLRWLLLLPGGSRERGLERMIRTRHRAELLAGEADYQLHLIYLWYENAAPQALDLLADLRRQYPRNPLFLQQIAAVEQVYLHDRTASLQTFETLIAAARAGEVGEAALAEVAGRLGATRQLDALFETDRAIDHLEAVVRLPPRAPYGALALAHLRLAAAHDRLGRRDRAVRGYRDALAAVPLGDPQNVRRQAEFGLRARPDPGAAEAYRLGLEGWRLTEQGDLAGAARALAQSLRLRPSDPVTRYRYGRLLEARGEDAAALAAYEAVVAARDRAAPTVLAPACLRAGLLLERAGAGDRAAAMYRAAATVFGAAAETRRDAERALERLQSRARG